MSIQVGTRVVMREAVPAASSLLPAGTVGEVVKAPLAPSNTYRIRFMDGHEISAARDAFRLLAAAKTAGLANQPSVLTEQACRERIIYQCVMGSRAYGLETTTSDTDRRGIYLAPTDIVLSLYDAPPQVQSEAD